MDDEKILALFFARDERAIRALGEKYGRAARALAGRILGSVRDVEECVNDAYLGVWRAIPPARPEALLPYLLKVVRNTCVKRYWASSAAKRGRALTTTLDELAEVVAGSDSVEDEFTAAELTREVEAFLDGLSVEDRTVFLRRFWFCDSYKSIAARTGLSEKAVSVRLARLRARLREHLTRKGLI